MFDTDLKISRLCLCVRACVHRMKGKDSKNLMEYYTCTPAIIFAKLSEPSYSQKEILLSPKKKSLVYINHHLKNPFQLHTINSIHIPSTSYFNPSPTDTPSHIYFCSTYCQSFSSRWTSVTQFGRHTSCTISRCSCSFKKWIKRIIRVRDLTSDD